MTDQERLDLAIAYAAGALEGPERDAVRARLAAGDAALTGAMAEADVVLARLAGTCAPIAPSAAVRQRVLDNLPAKTVQPASADAGSAVAGSAGATRGNPVAYAAAGSSGPLRLPSPTADAEGGRPRAATAPFPRLAAAAAVGALLVGGGLAYVGWQDRQARIARLEADLRDRAGQVADLRGALGSADARFTVLAPAGGDGKQEFGRVLVDPARQQVQVFLYKLVAPPPGKVYQLWLMPEGGGPPVPAPTFTVGPDQKATVTAAIPPGVSAVAGAAVSEEPPGGSATPTVVRLVSKAI